MAPTFRNTAAYDEDFVAWTAEQAAHLRAGDVARLDLAQLAEEIEALGVADRRELRRRLARLLQHLLKFQYQPELRSRSWATTIRVQRDEIAALIDDSPSLRPLVADILANAYSLGRSWAADETGLLALPEQCPWTSAEVLATEFMPQ